MLTQITVTVLVLAFKKTNQIQNTQVVKNERFDCYFNIDKTKLIIIHMCMNTSDMDSTL